MSSFCRLAILCLALVACDDDTAPPADACNGACDGAAGDISPPWEGGSDQATDGAGQTDSKGAKDSSLVSTWVGGTCTSDSDCQKSDPGAVCLMGGTWVWTGGYCSITCDPTAKPDACPTGSHCEELANTGPDIKTCIKDCLTKEDCRQGYVCAPIPGTSVGGCVVL